jgi:hypothetical protein
LIDARSLNWRIVRKTGSTFPHDALEASEEKPQEQLATIWPRAAQVRMAATLQLGLNLDNPFIWIYGNDS